MTIKPYTPEMLKTFRRIAERGGSYSHHTEDGEHVISTKTVYFNEHPESDLLFCLWITDYDNFTRHWVSFSDPLKNLNKYIQNFLFEKEAVSDWDTHIRFMKEKGIA